MNASKTMDLGDIPIGIEDFKELRNGGGYYVDKTGLIEHILFHRMTKVFLFTRPRRFGKSLNLSMLDAYLNKEYAGNDWFDGLSISETNKFDSDKNTNVVINLSLKDLDEMYDPFIEAMRGRVSKMYGMFKELASSPILDDEQKEMYLMYKKEKSSIKKLQTSLANLTELLKVHYGKPVIVLIDEYDDAINRAADAVERKRIVDFTRKFLSPALKGNGSLRFAVITGVMQIAKEEFFSGLNNIDVHNIFDIRADEFFGFTPGEVERICADYGRPEKYPEAKEWYDGYRFGNAEIYNPWSVLKYVSIKFIPDTYWAHTSGNAIIPLVLNSIDGEAAMMLSKILAGEETYSDLVPTVAYSDLDDADATVLLSILVMGGYLNASPADDGEKRRYRISIPNREMQDIFREEVHNHIRGMKKDKYTEFVDAALRSDVDTMRDVLIRVLSSIGERLLPNPEDSTRLMDCRFREANYNVMMLSILDVANDRFDIRGDMEAGDCRSDISMKSSDPSKPNIVMELKWRGDGDGGLEAAAESAINQIRKNKYCLEFKGRTILYGIAFRKRDVFIRCEEIVK